MSSSTGLLQPLPSPLPSIAVHCRLPVPSDPAHSHSPLLSHFRPSPSIAVRLRETPSERLSKNICLTTWILCNESCFRATKVFICLTAFGLNKSVLQMFYICCLRFALGSHCPDWDYFLYVFLRWDNFVPKLNILLWVTIGIKCPARWHQISR